MRLLLVPALLLLAGCPGPVRPDKPAPVPAQCDAQCYATCDTRMPLWQPSDPDSPRAWDELGEQVLSPAKDQLDRCELQRKACHQCIDRLKQAGVLL